LDDKFKKIKQKNPQKNPSKTTRDTKPQE